MRDYKKLQVWEKSHQLTLEIYKELNSFPREELSDLENILSLHQIKNL
ncbi:23S rRNA-intervening sequence protein [Paenimyroides aquimaris]|uniref:23S rRNA-intervening sequence protein n=1 Tax=Paenimyroides marinum TaxID=1159016 RepID=A0A1H6MQB3_9FLAO|nr:four helix bundle protein [Paenimyroides aquimaris]SEH99925.1 23S rRNA-intervening sequence protein [Paenimyroides aquimaris]